VGAVTTGAQRCTSVPLPVAFEHHFSVDEIDHTYEVFNSMLTTTITYKVGILTPYRPRQPGFQ
jgi:hypothetical protein